MKATKKYQKEIDGLQQMLNRNICWTVFSLSLGDWDKFKGSKLSWRIVEPTFCHPKKLKSYSQKKLSCQTARHFQQKFGFSWRITDLTVVSFKMGQSPVLDRPFSQVSPNSCKYTNKLQYNHYTVIIYNYQTAFPNNITNNLLSDVFFLPGEEYNSTPFLNGLSRWLYKRLISLAAKGTTSSMEKTSVQKTVQYSILEENKSLRRTSSLSSFRIHQFIVY